MTHEIATKKEPKAKKTHLTPTWDILFGEVVEMLESTTMDKPTIKFVLESMIARKRMGYDKHGCYLTPYNGRDSLTDAFQENLDLIAYIRNEISELDYEDEVAEEELFIALNFSVISLGKLARVIMERQRNKR